METYVDAVVEDIARAVANGMPPADTVFFGGGTPTRLAPELLARIVTALPVSANAEVTVECNPDDVTNHLMRVYADVGHGESLDDWRTTMNAIVALRPTHVSAYGLTVEAGTPLADDPSRHPDDDDQADKYIIADEVLVAGGFVNYEISNWAQPGHECRHNMVYWMQGNYQGFGCAAHSHHNGRRWWNVRTPDRYIACVAAGESVEAADEVLDSATRSREALELSLRTSRGVPVGTLDPADLGDLVKVEGERIVLTRNGRLLANDVSLRLKPR